MLGRKIAIYRTDSGALHALDARCPHLGADLGEGKVVGDAIRCAFHGWEIGKDGACVHAPRLSAVPDRRVRAYPTKEKWGYVWIWNGPATLFDLPEVPVDRFMVRMPSQKLRCHPHLMIANGFDAGHFTALHGMILTRSSFESKPHFFAEAKLEGRPASILMQLFTGTRDRPIESSIETFGGNMALVTVRSPVSFAALFTGSLSPCGGCTTRTILFLPRGILSMVRAIASLYVLLHDDRRILDSIDFSPGFVETDAPLKTFVDTINRMPTW